MFKPHLLFLSFFFIVICTYSQTVQSITVEDNNVSGGGFQSDVTITDDGQTVYSSADVAGIFKSTNGGLQYATINKGLRSPKVASLAITPDNDQILYAGTGDKGGSGGLFRSSDGGNTWQLTGAGSAAQFAGNHSDNNDPVPTGHPRSNGDLIVVDEGPNAAVFSDDIVIAGTYKDGVQLFTGGGEIVADAVEPGGFVRSVARNNAIPNKAYAAIYFENDNLNGIYEIDYTNPNSLGSTLVYPALRPEGLTVLGSGHVYAAVGDGGIAKFDGSTWTSVNTGLDTGNELRQWTAVTGYVIASNDIVYAGLNNQGGNANGAKYSTVWRTQNGGTTWTPLIESDAKIDHTIYGQSYEWWFSTDAFSPATPRGTNSIVSAIEVARGTQTNSVADDIIYISGRGGIWKSDNGGDLWKPAVYNMAVTANRGVAVNPNDPNQIMIANTDFVVLETNNRFEGSDIKRDKPNGAESRGYDAIFDAFANQLILGNGHRDVNNDGGGEVYVKDADAIGSPSGSGWTNTNLRGATAGNNGRVRAVAYGYHDGDAATTQTILAVVEGEGVYRYHNNAWLPSTGLTIGATKGSNLLWPDNMNSGVVYLIDLDQGFYRSNDGGRTWNDIWPSMNFNNNDFFNTGYLTADDNNPTTVYVSIQGRSGSPINTNFKVYRMTNADTRTFGAPGTAGITDITNHSGSATIRRPGPIVFGPDGRLWLTQQQNAVNNIFAALFVMENPTTDTSFVNVTNQEYENSAVQPSGIDVASDGTIYISQSGTGFMKISVQETGGPSNTTPVANAGTNQTVDANQLVTLDGSASSDADGDNLTYLWTAPNGIVLSDNTAVNPTFTAAEYNTTTNLTFSLVVNDGTVNSTADEVVITVNQVPNTAPVANAGTNQTVDANELVTLDGSASSDADGDNLTYLWTAPNGIVLSDNTAVNPTFTAAEYNTNTDLTFSLVVNDGTVNSTADEVVITVNQVPNTAPVANAGPNQTVDANELVTLDGSASSDADGDNLTYLWTAPNGIVLSDNTLVNPTFTATEYNTNTDLSFSLVVNDGTVNSMADEIVVTVSAVVIPNTAPVANAGTNQTVDANELVTLDGSASSDADGDNLTYLWTAPNGIVLSDNTAVNPTFIAPEYNTNTNLTFSLVVNDGTVNSTADEVAITVNQVSATNTAPVANAGTNQTVDANELVTLDGSASNDADGNNLTYLWTAPSGIVLSDNTVANPTFIASEYTTNTDLTFSLVVNDGTVNSIADEVVITVNQVPNTAPVANAGTNQTVDANELVTLDGSASSDVDGDNLTYLWTAPNGIVLSDNTAVNPTFTAPEYNTNTNLTFSLVVNDGTVNSSADEVVITVNQVAATNTAPVANAGTNQTVDANELVTLDGSASSDAEGDNLTYLWTAPNGIVLSDNTAVNPTFTAPEYNTNTDLTFSLVVNDGTVNSTADEVVLTVMAPAASNCNSLALETIISHESCSGEADGHISLVPSGGTAPYVYRFNEITTSPLIAGLSTGDYVVSVTDANNCTFSVDVSITALNELSVTTSVDIQEKLVTVYLEGAETYYITLNENTIATTDATVELPLPLLNNTLSVATNSECQGVFEENIVLNASALIYPNPITDGNFSVRNISEVNEPLGVEFFTITGKLFFKKMYQNEAAIFQDYIGVVPPGIYIVKITTFQETYYEKVLIK